MFLINPTQVGPNNCTGFSRFPISNHVVSAAADDINLVMTNQTGGAASAVSIVLSGTVGNSSVAHTIGGWTFNANDQNNMFFDLTGGTVFNTGQYRLNFTMTYTDRDNIARTDTATCSGTASS